MSGKRHRTTFGILTINDINNYGNRLQNYALQELLKEYGDTTTIRFETHSGSFIKRMKAHLRRPKMAVKSVIKIFCGKNKAFTEKRILNNLRFTTEYVPDNKLFITSSKKPNPRKLPDKIVIGSDQVWNYRWLTPEDLAMRLGLFSPADKIVTYAASIGVSDIPERYHSIFRKAFDRIPAISVREDRAKELVETISSNKATVVLDPTLMISAEKWGHICRNFVSNGEKYVLTYFLGEPSMFQESIINDYAMKNHLRIRRILDSRDQETITAGPQDFVELFSKASYVFTDSYHACCFSIIFNKSFKVFNRSDQHGTANMNSRMQTLFHLFELNDIMSDENALETLDYTKINALLKQHQTESKQWLEAALRK